MKMHDASSQPNGKLQMANSKKEVAKGKWAMINSVFFLNINLLGKYVERPTELWAPVQKALVVKKTYLNINM